MKMVLGVLAVLCLSGGAGELKMKIPATLYPVPEKRSMDRKTIAAAEAYLKLSPEKLASLVPKEPPAPVLTETAAYSSSYHQGGCPFCGLSGKWFRYDLVNDPDRIYCMQTGKELSEFGSQGSDFFLDYSGRKYARKYYLSPHVKPILPKSGFSPFAELGAAVCFRVLQKHIMRRETNVMRKESLPFWRHLRKSFHPIPGWDIPARYRNLAVSCLQKRRSMIRVITVGWDRRGLPLPKTISAHRWRRFISIILPMRI